MGFGLKIKRLAYKRAPGMGIALILAMGAVTLMILTSLLLVSGNSFPKVLNAGKSSIVANDFLDMGEIWSAGWLKSDMEHGWYPDVGWTYHDTFYPYDNIDCIDWNCPASDEIGYYDMTVTKVSGYNITMNVVIHYGDTTASKTFTIEANPFSCKAIEEGIVYDNLWQIEDVKLIRYGYQYCAWFNHNWWESMNAAVPGDGSSAGDCTTSTNKLYDPPSNTPNPGILQLRDVSGNCAVKTNTVNTVNFYNEVHFRDVTYGRITINNGLNGRITDFKSLTSAGGATTLTLNGDQYHIVRITTASRPGSNALMIDASAATGFVDLWIDDVVGTITLNGSSGGQSTWIDSTWTGGTITLGAAENWIALASMTGGTFNANAVGAGSQHLYFSNLSKASGSFDINTGDDNDEVNCTQVFQGSACGQVKNVRIFTNGGDDYIFLNTTVQGSNTVINAGSGCNVVFIAGQSAGAITTGADGCSMVVVDGDRTGGSIDGGGGDSVLLVKNGIALGSSITGFARTLYYDGG